MFRSFYILLLIGLLTTACNKTTPKTNSSAKYTYNVDGWETLGSQTIVMLDAGNPSLLDQDIHLTIEAINKDGKSFKKDTSIHFTAQERNKDFTLLLDTEGEIEKVKIEASEL